MGGMVTDRVAVSESALLMRLRRLFAADLSVADRRNEVPTAVTTGEQEREGDHGGGAARLHPHTCAPRILRPPLSAHTFHIIPCLLIPCLHITPSTSAPACIIGPVRSAIS